MDKPAGLRETVAVNLGERSYDIVIGEGLIDRAGEEIADRLPNVRAAIVTDTNVADCHLQRLQYALQEAGIDHTSIVNPPGEATKSWSGLTKTVEAILEARLERSDIVIALGGGVVGDLAGFAASAVRRGMGFVQMPTSLLAQVDSSVGGKTGINTHHGKNLVGAFYQPRLVLADTGALDTLPPRDFRAGYAEVAKYGLIDDEPFFAWLEANWRAVFSGGSARVQAIATSCRAKARVVAADEREHGARALLNLGHTFGHALEAATGYDAARLVHGEAIAIGMTLAMRYSHARGLVGENYANRVESHFKTVGLPTSLSAIPGDLPPTDVLMQAIAQDKKVKRGQLTFILVRGIGGAFIADHVPADEVRSFLDKARTWT